MTLAETPPVSAAQHRVNGCIPTSDPVWFGFCLSSRPFGRPQNSYGFLYWSGIYVGDSVNIRGAVPVLASGRPQDTSVVILAPGGQERLIPVKPNEGFEATVRFEREGLYVIGVVYHGHLTDLTDFFVAYRYTVLDGKALSNVFPDSSQKYPRIDTVLAVPQGRPSILKFKFLGVGGRPARNQDITYPGAPGLKIKTDGEGIATVKVDPRLGLESIDSLYAGLFVQSYTTVITPEGKVVPLPNIAGRTSNLPSVLSGPQSDLYKVSEFIVYVDPFEFPTAPTLEPNTNTFQILNVSLDVKSGSLTKPLYNADGQAQGTADIGRVTPVLDQGQVYLTAKDLTTVLNSFAWAELTPEGLLFSNYTAP